MSYNLSVLLILTCMACQSTDPPGNAQIKKEVKNPLSFDQTKIIDSTQHWWAHCPAEINDDGVMDLVFINNNSAGGYLGYYLGNTDGSHWELKVVADKTPEGLLFASGDLECADMDGDGDIDIFAVQHPGEWVDADAPAKMMWYENPSWDVHPIGSVPNAVKDVSFSDFDLNGKMDLAVLTFAANTLSIFSHDLDGSFARVSYFQGFKNLHEGMYTGDADGDGYPDVAANGMLFMNPSGTLTDEWIVDPIDPKWHNQEGDWSRNATKCFMRDLDADGQQEVFISHSERAGYPLSWYRKSAGGWQEHVIADSIPACHTLQVFDFDLDGDFDVLAGVNAGRAVNLGKTSFPMIIFLSSEEYSQWTPKVLLQDGVYNGQAADYDGDGDMDIFRYPSHEAKSFFLLENKVKG
ncbi:MAG: VCBS repeat-containing protein [Saprospiraceae bacterium]|nr:VCBS repeat-containing protein [Saprospiraceae bacterium]